MKSIGCRRHNASTNPKWRRMTMFLPADEQQWDRERLVGYRAGKLTWSTCRWHGPETDDYSTWYECLIKEKGIEDSDEAWLLACASPQRFSEWSIDQLKDEITRLRAASLRRETCKVTLATEFAA